MAKSQVVSFTLPPDVVRDLTYVSRRMNVSRSAVLSQLLDGPVADLRRLLEDVPEKPTQEDVLRLRGSSRQVIEDRLDNLKSLGIDLFVEGSK